MTEIWKDIIGYEGYQVSNLSEVKSIERDYLTHNNAIRHISEHFVKKRKNHKGYDRVTLCKNGSKKTIAVHILVAMHFVPNPDNKPQVDHIDGNKQNNIWTNLRWVDNKTNANNPNTVWKNKRKHTEATKKKMSLSHKGKITKQCLEAAHNKHQKPVGIIKDGRLVKTYSSLTKASTDLNVSISAITNAIKRNGNCRGYKWEFIS